MSVEPSQTAQQLNGELLDRGILLDFAALGSTRPHSCFCLIGSDKWRLSDVIMPAAFFECVRWPHPFQFDSGVPPKPMIPPRPDSLAHGKRSDSLACPGTTLGRASRGLSRARRRLYFGLWSARAS